MYRWHNNKKSVVEILTGKIIPVSERNSDWQEVLEWIEQGNIPDEEFDIEQRKDEVIAKISTIRSEKKRAGVEVDGVTYQSDNDSKHAVHSKIQAMESGIFNHVRWVAKNSIVVIVDLDDLRIIHREIEQYHQACFDKSSELINEVFMSESPEDIDIESGWPQAPAL